jgi:hypothetical protein
VDLQNDFTTGDNHYPKNHQLTLHLLDKYSKTAVAKVTQSEGTSFAQRSGRRCGHGERSDNGKIHDNIDKEYWKDNTCYKFEKKGHPANKCPKKSNNDDNEKSMVSTASSVNNFKKDFKSMKKALDMVNTQLEKLKEADYDLSGSEDDDDQSHFQMDAALQFAQVDTEFEPTIANLFKQAGSSANINLWEVILLDSQSTMDLLCNAALVSKTYTSTTSMRLKSNSGTMVVTLKATMQGYNKDVWFSTRAIANIITCSSLIQQYGIMYDSDDKMCVVNQESQGKPNMEFQMHKCGLHYYHPRNEKHVVFVNTVSENKEGFTKRQIKGALYKTLSYPSMTYFKWVIRDNRINDCPVTVQDIDVALKIWVKNIAALKVKTTQSKTIPVTRDIKRYL